MNKMGLGDPVQHVIALHLSPLTILKIGFDVINLMTGDNEIRPVDYLLLISEMEGACTYTKKYGWTEDHEILRKMCNRYYKEYFKLKKKVNILLHNPDSD